MSILNEEIIKAFDQLWAGSSDRNWIPGLLGTINGDIDVVGKAGYVYVSLGINGEEGESKALDAAGVAKVAGTPIRMRRENGELVIREATAYATGSGGSGATNLNALTDVTLSGVANGQTLQYNAGSGQWINVVPPGGPGGAPSPHDLSGPHHSGLLAWEKINFNGSSLVNLQSRNHNLLTGIGPDDHHTRVHDLITGDVNGPVHTVTGAAWQVVGVNPANTPALLDTSSNPANTQKILRTDATGNFRFDTTLMVVDADSNRVGINTLPQNGVGAAALDILAANLSDHTQRIRQVSGQTGRLWRIEDVSGNELIVLNSVGDLQSGHPGFVSGLLGWQITHTGNAEFNDIWARGELHATVFVKDEIHATGGSFFVATAGNLHTTVTFSSAPTQSYDLEVKKNGVLGDLLVTAAGVPLTITTMVRPKYPIQVKSNNLALADLIIKTTATEGTTLDTLSSATFIEVGDPPSGPAQYFQRGEVIRSKTEVPTGVTDYWFRINSFTQMEGYGRYNIERLKGSDGSLPKASALVSYGKEGDGRIMMTSDLNYAPYIDVFTTGYEVWTGNAGSVIPRVRIGRLDGVGLPGISGVEQYGMVAGLNLSDANSPFFIASNLQIALYRVPFRMNNGTSDTVLMTPDGNFKLGTNIGQLPTTGFAFDPASGNLLIGRKDAQFLEWDQGTGRLSINGDLIVGGGGLATVTYVDGRDAAVNTAAQGYANVAQGNAATDAANKDTQVKADAALDATNKDTQVKADAALDATTKANQAKDDAVLDANGYTNTTYQNMVTYVNGQIDINEAEVKSYADAGRVSAVVANWFGVAATNTISWTGASVKLGNGATIPIVNGTTGPMGARTYLLLNLSTITTTGTFTPTTNSEAITSNLILIAICDPGSKGPTVRVMAGTTMISGDQIITGSIVTANIDARAITANLLAADAVIAEKILAGAVTAIKLQVGRIDAINQGGVVTTGNLSVDGNLTFAQNGFIKNPLKTWTGATPTGAGVFMGYVASLDRYCFDAGNDTTYIRWNGTALELGLTKPLTVANATPPGDILYMVGSGGGQMTMRVSGTTLSFTNAASGGSNTADMYIPLVTCEKAVIYGNTLQVATQRVIKDYNQNTGNTGEICWGYDDTAMEGGVSAPGWYLYICRVPGVWTRARLDSSFWT